MFPIYFLICIFLFLAEVSAGTLDDIRAKSGYQPKEHTKRETASIPFLTPAELIADLSKYRRNNIRMHVVFKGLTTKHLEERTYSGYKWSVKRYIEFDIEEKDVTCDLIHLFLNKNSPYKNLLVELHEGSQITITGFVTSIQWEMAWIAVSRIERGWVE